MDKQILMKYDIGELYEKLLDHFNFNLETTILTTFLHKSINTFWACLNMTAHDIYFCCQR
jgi:hypothetical protein